jgi:hypothetical protein
MRLVLVPGLITLGITILRLVGELQHWPKALFNAAAGGPLAIVGIVWLPIIFGPYFALKLAGEGEGPASLGKAFGFTALGLVLTVGAIALFAMSAFKSLPLLLGSIVLFIAAFVVPIAGWPALTKTLITYGYAARIPVAIVMFFAIQGNWGTHYDAPPPEYPADVSLGTKYFQLGFVPQLALWVAYTVIVGSLFGAIAYAVAGRRKVAVPASS